MASCETENFWLYSLPLDFMFYSIFEPLSFFITNMKFLMILMEIKKETTSLDFIDLCD